MRFVIYIVVVFFVSGCNSLVSKYNTEDLIGYWAIDSNENVDFIFKEDGVIEYLKISIGISII